MDARCGALKVPISYSTTITELQTNAALELHVIDIYCRKGIFNHFSLCALLSRGSDFDRRFLRRDFFFMFCGHFLQ